MDKEILLKIREYIEQNNIAKIGEQKSKMQLRAEGKVFTLEEHLQGMIYSFLSAQTVWANIENHFTDIDKLFFGYDKEKIKQHEYMYYVIGINRLNCGSRLTNAQMKFLHKNIETIESIPKQYGLDKNQARELYRDVRFYTHGLSCQIATKSIIVTEQEIQNLIKNIIMKVSGE